MKMHDFDDDRIIDFSKAKKRKTDSLNTRKKRKLITLIVLGAVIVFVCAVLFLQAREVTDDKGFWQNFNTSQQARVHSNRS